MHRPTLGLALVLSFGLPAVAMVGNAPTLSNAGSQPEVMIVGSRDSFCTGVAIARDLVLTAAHCVLPGAEYKLAEKSAQHGLLTKDVVAVARHPQFSIKTLLAHRATADVALLKLKAPLAVTPAMLGGPRGRIAVGERFVVHGYGSAVRNDVDTLAVLRTATLAATGQPGSLQLRLVDPATNNVRSGLGACTGDSGAPVYQQIGQGLSGTLAVIGVVSWSTGPNGDDGCGGLTGVTPLELYRGWVIEQAKRMGSAIGP